jgi:hypothetical protein
MMHMGQNENQTAPTDAQLHESDSSLPDQEGNDGSGSEQAHEGMFLCTQGDHWLPRSEAFKSGKNPSICRACAAGKREQGRRRVEEELAVKVATIDQIPSSEQRGGTKRSTFTLSQYVITTLDVLAVGSSTSEVVERAVIQLLEREDPQVISFVGRMFQQSMSK